MKFIQIKIFKVSINYFILIEKIRIFNSCKIIEQEFYKEVYDKKEAEYYITSFLNDKDFRKYKYFINYISNDPILEVISDNNDFKTNYQNELNVFYPNYQLEYDVHIGKIKINNKNRKIVCVLMKKETNNDMKSFIRLINKKNIVYGVDLFLLQSFINQNKHYFLRKYIVIIQKTYHYYRIYKVFYGKIVDYLVVKDETSEFNTVFDKVIATIDYKVDEVIVDLNYKEYIRLTEKLLNINVVLISYLNNLNYLDERKIVYAKKIK